MGGPARPLTEKISTHIANNCSRYFGAAALDVRVSGSTDVDYWSIINIYTVVTSGGAVHTVYCKMPKSRWGLSLPEQLLSDPSAGAMAHVEFASLTRLYSFFNQADPSLRVIRPLDLLQEPSAVLTEGVPGTIEVFQRLRTALKAKGPQVAGIELMTKCGQWLAHLHRQSIKGIGLAPVPRFPEQVTQLKLALESLRHRGGRTRLLQYFAQAERLPADDTDVTCIAEGFEVRNFISNADGIFFLDPGQLMSGSRYEDLARFLASLGILYWGKLRLLWKYPCQVLLANAFVQGYQSVFGPLNLRLLGAYMLKEYLKLWVMGLLVLEFKRCPAPLKWLGRSVYLPTFFRKAIDEQLTLLATGLSRTAPHAFAGQQSLSFPGDVLQQVGTSRARELTS